MDRVELLTVADTFWIARNEVQVLVLRPDFSVPEWWKNRTEPVVVLRPDGEQVDAIAEMSMSHLTRRGESHSQAIATV